MARALLAKIVALVALSCLLTACATANMQPNPLSADVRKSLKLQGVEVRARGDAVSAADMATMNSMMALLRGKLQRNLAVEMDGARAAIVQVEVTKFAVDKRILSVTPTTMAIVKVVDAQNNAVLASYRASHSEPLGRATMAVISTDSFVADGMAGSIANHISSKTVHRDVAVPNAGGVLGQIL